MGESFAGITVPDGSPDGLHAAAADFEGLSGLLGGLAGQLQGLPGSMPSWQGPASVSYAGSCVTTAGSTTGASQSVTTAGHATRQYAHALEDAQREARQAIAEARDATNRIKRAKAEIDQARSDQATAAQQADHASHELAVSAAHGLPSPRAQASLRDAGNAADAAAGRERRARQELDQAERDLHRAQRRGREAEQRARDAARSAAAGFGATTGPTIGPAGPPGSPVIGATGNSLLYDALIAPGDLSNPDNQRALGAGLAAGGPKAYAEFRGKYTRVSGYWRTSPSGAQSWVDPYWRRLPAAADVKPDRFGTRWSTGPTATKWAGRAEWLGRAGDVAAVGVAGYNQWQHDASNPSLTTTDRVGRASGAAVYDGGAAVAGGWAGAVAGAEGGAAIGTFVGGPIGTAVGGAIGGLVGGIAGSGIATGVADHFTAAKDWAVNEGEKVANTVSTGLHKVEHFIDSISPF